MMPSITLSDSQARTIGWSLLLGPVAGAAYSLTSQTAPALIYLAIVMVSLSIYLLACGYSVLTIGSRLSVIPNESERVAILFRRANSPDVRTVDILVHHSTSVRWFVQQLLRAGKDVRLFVRDPNAVTDPIDRLKCVNSLSDVISTLSVIELARLHIYGYSLSPTVRGILLRGSDQRALTGSLGWYTHAPHGVGGSRYPALMLTSDVGDEHALFQFAEDELSIKLRSSRILHPEEIAALAAGGLKSDVHHGGLQS